MDAGNYLIISKYIIMKRVNIFNQIHKGLRTALYETALLLQRTDFTNETEIEDAFAASREVLMLFDEHARKEDKYVFPVIQPFEPSIANSFEEEHDKDHSLAHSLEQAMDAFHYLASVQEKLEAGRNINHDFVAFLSFNLDHMAREENMINQILWRYFDDAYILDIQKTIVRNTEPWHNDFFSKWMLRGNNDRDIQGWLRSVQLSAPTLVFNTLFKKAEQELPQPRFQKLMTSLSEGAILV
jgi:hemerythrin-like domain-containing protein